MFRIVSRASVVLPPLPKWEGGAGPACGYSDVVLAVQAHSRGVLPRFAADSAYISVPLAALGPAVAWTHDALRGAGITYGANSFDCENFQRELCQTLAKMAFKAGVPGAPLIGGMSVRQQLPWGGVLAGGAHQVVGVWVREHGLMVLESQQRELTIVRFDEYPNRRDVFALSDF